jgi:uncharacterized membrane protein YdfJ with MMPL/SSD domain
MTSHGVFQRRIWRHRRLVLGVWALVVILAVPLAAHQNDHLSGGGFANLGSQSAKVASALQKGRFPGVQDDPLALLIVPRKHARPGDLSNAIHAATRNVEREHGTSVSAENLNLALESARAVPALPVIIPLDFKGGEEQTIDLASRLREGLGIEGDHAGSASGGRVEVHLAGQGALWAAFRVLADKNAKQAESRGFPIIAIVLLAVFGSLAAAALPLSLGVAAVVITGAIIYLLSLFTEMSVFVTSIASMIGTGVAVDYSLFVLVRYREEIGAGRSPDDARAIAMSTSGRAVILAGATVMVSLAALFLIPSPGVRSMAVGAIVVVAISILGAATLLPVLIGVFGRRAYEQGRIGAFFGRLRRGRRAAPEIGFWVRWSRAVMRRPVLSLLVATTLLLALAAPALDLHVRNSAASQLGPKNEVTQARHQIANLLGPGSLGPVWALVEFPRGNAREAQRARVLSRIKSALSHDRSVSALEPTHVSKSGRSVLLSATFKVDPESQAARTALLRLRKSLPAAAGSAATVAIGGTTAELFDFDRLVSTSLWRPVLFVLAMSFLVLLVLLRSVVLPLKAMLMNTLSVAASYGALVAVFQFGWLSFIGLEKASSIYPITLPLVLVVAFGLSMDYHVFLLSRVRERYMETGDSDQAVADALASSATPITSAALIMIAVFLSFVGSGVPSVKQLGFAAAVAIAVDATIVRLVIVPAAMKLLGRWNWWLPESIERRLPTGIQEPVLERVGAAVTPEPLRATVSSAASAD